MTATSHPRRRLLQALALPAALVLTLGGCASTPAPQAEREALLQRAREYWALVQQNDKLRAWPYEAASKDPKANLEAYVKRGGVTFDAIEIQGVQSMDQGKAVVTVQQRYSLPLLRLPNQQATLQDQWHLIDGQWYHYQPLSVAFPEALPREGSQQAQ
ncbi:MAG: hypothetical protein JSR53_03470 [Proteobacteria bacterium]|nr:hypothetical protein [Pseudomonadota bacterium]